MSIYYVAGLPFSSELYHHGIKGQKWGVRRYQNLDGTLTPEGRERYLKNSDSAKQHIRDGYDRYKHKLYDEYKKDNGRGWKETIKKYKPLLLAINKTAIESSGADKAEDTLRTSARAAFYNKNPFKSRQLNQNYENAIKDFDDKYKKYIDIVLNMSDDAIRHIPKEDRDKINWIVYHEILSENPNYYRYAFNTGVS